MNTNTAEQILDEVPTVPGTPYGGGFYVGRFALNGDEYALITAPKAEGEHDDTAWHTKYDDIPGATRYVDGLADTQAMAEAGSALAQWALDLNINGLTDWYLPSVDELEMCYRALKPTTDKNSLYARSGINLSAVSPTRPYTADEPAQTIVEAFRAGGGEAFEADAYWTSTQHAGYSGYAWAQTFDDGDQDGWDKDGYAFRARAVRKIKL